MKFGQLFIGLVIGGLLGVVLTKHFGKSTRLSESKTQHSSDSETWHWADSLDALRAAPDNHKVVFEDDNVRVLAVVLNAKQSEPVHTHKWKSIMWIATPVVPCQITNYKSDGKGNLIKSDSLIINDMPVNMGQFIDPEGPTSISNLGSDDGVAYRVEFKKDFLK